jgi:hypothetical protein
LSMVSVLRSARLRGSAHGRGGWARPACIPPIERTVWEPPRARPSSRWPNRRRLGLLFAHPSFRRKTSRCIRRTRSKKFSCLLVRCCVSGLATAPRMRTPVAGFCRLVGPCPRTLRLLTPLESSPGTAEPLHTARSAAAPPVPRDTCCGFTQRPRTFVSAVPVREQRA